MDHDEVMVDLNKKLDAAWNAYTNQTLSRSREYIFEHAVEIAAAQTVYQALQNGGFPQEYLEFLLRFEDPLEVVHDQWLDENNVYIDESMLHVLRSLMDKLQANHEHAIGPSFLTRNGESATENRDNEFCTIKLYYPAYVSKYEQNEYGDSDDDPTELSESESAGYLPDILARIYQEQSDEESERGLMAYYDRNDSIDEKVISAHPSAEVVDGRLYGVAVCQVAGELTTEELELLKDYWTGQMSDGFGEGFEQREIRCREGGGIYVSFWSFNSDWSIMTKDALLRYEQTEDTYIEQQME